MRNCSPEDPRANSGTHTQIRSNLGTAWKYEQRNVQTPQKASKEAHTAALFLHVARCGRPWEMKVELARMRPRLTILIETSPSKSMYAALSGEWENADCFKLAERCRSNMFKAITVRTSVNKMPKKHQYASKSIFNLIHAKEWLGIIQVQHSPTWSNCIVSLYYIYMYMCVWSIYNFSALTNVQLPFSAAPSPFEP